MEKKIKGGEVLKKLMYVKKFIIFCQWPFFKYLLQFLLEKIWEYSTSIL